MLADFSEVISHMRFRAKFRLPTTPIWRVPWWSSLSRLIFVHWWNAGESASEAIANRQLPIADIGSPTFYLRSTLHALSNFRFGRKVGRIRSSEPLLPW